MKLIDWTLGADGPPIVNDCCTGGAGRNLLLPRWVAVIVHVPSPMRWTLTPVTLQIPALPSSAPSSTGSPEVALAFTLYGGSWTWAPDGGVERKLIVWAATASSTSTDCVICGCRQVARVPGLVRPDGARSESRRS